MTTRSRDRLLESGYVVVAIVLGGVQAWMSRFQPSTMDAVSYLDVGDAYLHGHWSQAINGYWNPLYSWILGVVMAVVRPSAELEYPTAKAVDYVIYVLCLITFSWFLSNVRATYRANIARESGAGPAIPDWAWIVGGYSLFLWSSLKWIMLTSSTPDMAAAALAFCAWGLVLRMERGERRSDYPLLGVVLALGYFARTPLFIVACVILPFVAFHHATPERRRGALAASLVFVALTAPFVVALSRAREHVTIGDNAILNHAWLANPGSYIIPNRHWQGGPPGYGIPKHSSHVIWDSPLAFEFAGPIGGTFPPWTDPSYWYEGLTYHFDAAAESRSLGHNARFYYDTFGRWIVFGVAGLLLLAGDLRGTLRAVTRNARYWVPAATGLALYFVAADMLHDVLPTQPPSRYVAVFAVLLYSAIATSLRFRPVARSALAKTAGALLFAAISVGMLATLINYQRHALGQKSPVPPSQVARSLRERGVTGGMRVATIGSPDRHAFWARLAKVDIVAEIPNDVSFWSKSPEVQERLLRILEQHGIQAVVSPWIRPSSIARGWRPATGTSYGVRVLGDDPVEVASRPILGRSTP